MNFEKYWEENASKETWANKAVAANIWADKQAEIDKLQKELSTTKQVLHNVVDMERAKKDELQKKIDKASNLITNWWHPDVDQELFIESLGKAIGGGHE